MFLTFFVTPLTFFFSKKPPNEKLNKIINKESGIDIISSYKRASNIIENELKDNKLELADTADPGIFKNDFEKNLFKKIKELKKYFTNIDNDENYETTLNNLKTAKPESRREHAIRLKPLLRLDPPKP